MIKRFNRDVARKFQIVFDIFEWFLNIKSYFIVRKVAYSIYTHAEKQFMYAYTILEQF